jgi:hypothetical protein
MLRQRILSFARRELVSAASNKAIERHADD